jgi:hypothetical protein
MATTIERPSVQVIQQFQTVSPTILTPTLPASIVGPCIQVIEAVRDDGSLNTDARIYQPARLALPWVSTPFAYTSIGTDTLSLSVNNAAAVDIVFATGPNLTADEVADAINEEGIPGLLAIVEQSGSQKRVVIYTTTADENSSLEVGAATSADVLTAFGLTVGYRIVGATGYNNYWETRLQLADYPDPRGIIDEVVVNYDTVRVFVNNGAGTVREVLTTETFLRGATSAVTVQDDGDGDNLSPYLDFAGANFAASPADAVATGNADLTLLTYASDVQGRVLRMAFDGEQFQQIVFGAGVTTPATLVSAINALWGAGRASLSVDNLRLTSPSPHGGVESEIRIDKTASDATLLTNLGLTGVGAPFNSTDVIYGVAFRPVVGDEVWVGGLRLGQVTEVPASPTNRLRISAEQLLTFTGSSWYIVAKGLDNTAATATRPSSDLTIDENTGTLRVKHNLFRATNGAVSPAGPLSVYVAYNALRQDVSPAGSNFNLLRIGTTTDLAAQLSPIDTQNPLGLGMYAALLNAPSIEVTGCGVDETNAAAPEGTLDAYVRAFEYLESKDVYAIAPLTHSNDVGQVGDAHVTTLSAPENGMERIVLLNPRRPTRKSDTVVASSAAANVSGAPTDIVNTGIANLQALLAAAGMPGPSFSEADGVFIAFEGDTNKYLVQSVAGGLVTVNDGPLSSSNDFYYDVNGGNVFTDAIVDRPCTVFIRGAALTNRTDEAVAYSDIARGYANRRVICTAPDTARMTIDGLETAVAGYYLAAALAGKMSAVSPSQPLTEEAITGFAGVVGSHDRYSEMQLKIMSGGGLWVFYQKADGQPVRTRHQLTTDMSSVEKREASIGRAVDFTAKFIREGLRNFIGGFNITTNIQDAISVTLDGLKSFLIRQGVIASMEINAIRQSASAPDTLEIDCTLGVLYPLNYIRVTLVI